MLSNLALGAVIAIAESVIGCLAARRNSYIYQDSGGAVGEYAGSHRGRRCAEGHTPKCTALSEGICADTGSRREPDAGQGGAPGEGADTDTRYPRAGYALERGEVTEGARSPRSQSRQGKINDFALPVLVSYNGSKSPVERRPPPELSVDLVQSKRSRETNLLAVLMAERMAFQLASLRSISRAIGMGLVFFTGVHLA